MAPDTRHVGEHSHSSSASLLENPNAYLRWHSWINLEMLKLLYLPTNSMYIVNAERPCSTVHHMP